MISEARRPNASMAVQRQPGQGVLAKHGIRFDGPHGGFRHRTVGVIPMAEADSHLQIPGLTAALASFTLLPVGWAIAFAILVAANTLLLYVGPFAR